MKNYYKKHNKGSSLVFVIIAVAFVGILGSILLNVTLINIETKGTDRAVKKNFYKTESVMDKLNFTLENISGEAMQDAYVKLLEGYTTNITNSTDQAKHQREFALDYLNNILDRIAPLSSTSIVEQPPNSGEIVFHGGNYDIEKIKTELNSDFSGEGLDSYIATDPGSAQLELCFDGKHVDSEKYLLLKNMKVKYFKNPDGTNKDAEVSTWITTDIKFSVPILRFEGGGTYPNFTEYAIIGDEEVSSSGQATVDGSLYAGMNGFNINSLANVSVKRKSANIITRGKVNVQQQASLTLGEENNLVNVYATDYETSKSSASGSLQKATLRVYANSYIMDDLSLDAPYSDVYFGGGGAYYGYSFNKDNTTDTKTTLDANYSSAILINGRYSALDMSGMQHILLGGRAYISNFHQSNESYSLPKKNILMGESLSVKSNQNFYLVSPEHLKDGCTNPMTWAAYQSNAPDGEVLSDEVTRPSSQIGKLLKSGTGQGAIPYIYDISGTSGNAALVYFYYNFKSQTAADTYFKKYCDKEDLRKKIVSSEYLQFGENSISKMGITITSNVAMFASGNWMTYTSNGNNPGTFEVHDEKTIPAGDEPMLKQQSIDYARTYKALQLELSTHNKDKFESTYEGSDAEKTTGFGMSAEQLKGKQIFDSIMTIRGDRSSTQHDFVKDAGIADTGFNPLPSTSVKVKAVAVDVNGTKVWAIFVVDSNTSSTASPISLESILANVQYNDNGTTLHFNRNDHVAIVVANCGISANCKMRGLIISDTKVVLASGADIIAEPALLRDMFRVQRTAEGGKQYAKDKFITYFAAFSGFSAGQGSNASDAVVDISRYITYSNWKKNND